MVSGKCLSEREKAFIRENKDNMSLNFMARMLGDEFPEDNGGTRSRYPIREYVKELSHPQKPL